VQTKTRANIVAVLTAGLLLTASPALAAGSVEETGDGELLARGAGVSIPITFMCDQGRKYALDVNLVQSISQERIALGAAFLQGDCTGSSETHTVTVPSFTFAFRTGPALAIVGLVDCDAAFVCGQRTTTSAEITVND
jgi:hypothetical protein